MSKYTEDQLGLAAAIQEVLIREIGDAFTKDLDIAPQEVIRAITPEQLIDKAYAHAQWACLSTCDCGCPDEPCTHKWDGPFEESDSGLSASITCSKCRMWKMDHDMAVGP